MKHRDYSLIGTTQSLWPDTLELVPAKIIEKRGRVYFRKRHPDGRTRDDFVCSDVGMYDQMQYSVPAKIPAEFGIEPDKGCPYDCGLCTEHEQHTCIGLVEITSSCNLSCPMCYAQSGPGGKHLSFEECKRSIDRLVEAEGEPEVIQLSGGEPTIHPQFAEIYAYAISQPFDYVMINTNGIRFAHDAAMVEMVAAHRDRTEIYLQFDGFKDSVSLALRGESVVETKLKAIERLGNAGLHITLVVTLQPGVNDDEMGAIVKFGLERPHITGISFQPATYSGRHVLPADLERRVTFPDVIRGVAEQTDGLFSTADFLPLPCAHPNCHQLAYAFRTQQGAIPLTRFFDAANNLDLLANGISFTRPAVANLIQQYLGRQGCCAGGDCGGLTQLEPPTGAASANGGYGAARSNGSTALLELLEGGDPHVAKLAEEFFTRAVAQDLGVPDVFRITITNFLDAYNFDVRRLMRCCTHHVLPSGHIIPFCVYNVLYRDG
ncbi:MAG: radical SAM protein, partial [Planctomycetales bacterium]|nr:radical SAM protein [Planctomycetales bacterium]